MASQAGGSGILTASFQSLSQELALLRVSFDNWVGMKKRECIDSKETYNKTILEQNDLLERLKRDLESLADQKTNLYEVLQAENEEESQLRNENAALNSQINAQQSKLLQAREAHSKIQNKLQAISQTIDKYQNEKVTLVKEVYPKLKKLKEILGLEVKCISLDQLRVEFSLQDTTSNSLLLCFIELDIAQDADWKMINCVPKILNANEIIAMLNISHNFAQFCVDLRKEFQFAINKQNN